ncbi:MAG: hypothetical protein L6R39_000626 [Caloplaca ligustica]|nr:MAG: hypothetical protein L6R39_000626 [Caloplaca ligustica]
MSSTISSTGGPIYFFREHEHPYGFLSQWYNTAFTAVSPDPDAAPMTFTTTEQYMMYHKAMLFNDREIADQIMLADTPKLQQALGRKVKNFDSETWNAHREKIVEEGNWNKFCNSKSGTTLRDMLVKTGKRELVEASPVDRRVIWGIGYGANNADQFRENWGENLLGKALMRVRDRINAQPNGSQ